MLMATECPKCKGTGQIAIRSRDGTYAFPGPVPDDAKGYLDADCWFCDSGGVIDIDLNEEADDHL